MSEKNCRLSGIRDGHVCRWRALRATLRTRCATSAQLTQARVNWVTHLAEIERGGYAERIIEEA